MGGQLTALNDFGMLGRVKIVLVTQWYKVHANEPIQLVLVLDLHPLE